MLHDATYLNHSGDRVREAWLNSSLFWSIPFITFWNYPSNTTTVSNLNIVTTQGDILVNWGDGTSNQVINSNTNTNRTFTQPTTSISIAPFNKTFVTNINCGTSSSTQTDPFFNNVSLLLHMDGTNGSQTFIDSSSNSYSLTANGNAQISTSIKKFGTGSALFDANNDYVKVPVDAGEFGSGDFTIECWVYANSKVATDTVISKGVHATIDDKGWTLEWIIDNGNWKLAFYGYGEFTTGIVRTNGDLSTGNWYHIAVVKDGSNFRMYLDGVDQTDHSGNPTISTLGTGGKLLVGSGFYDPTTRSFDGYIDELRITKGVARYTANFTPPTLPFPHNGKLRGTIDISAFPNLQDFRCNNNDITAINGYAQNSNLKTLQFFDNKVTGSLPSLSDNTGLIFFSCNSNLLTGPIPSLSGLSNLESFNCTSNLLTGPIPSLSGLSNLESFNCNANQLTGPIPSLSGLSNLREFRCQTNQLTGPIPSLSGLSNLESFQCQSQTGAKLTGSIPSLSGLNNLKTFHCATNQLTGSIPSLSGLSNLEFFGCFSNQLTGSIPSLSGLNNLGTFICYSNQLTDFDGGSVSNTLGNFQAQNNQLPQSAVDAILAEFVAANRTTGTRTLNLGGTNASPTGGVNNTDKLTLEGRGWLVTVTP